MGLMALNLATLNARGLRDSSKCVHLLGELSYLGVNVAAVQETHTICTVDCQVLENDYVVLSAYGSCSSVGVSLLIEHSLNANVNLVLADDRGWLVANVVVRISSSGWLWFMLPISLQRGFSFFSGQCQSLTI